jgi:GntR family transcriptional regulator
MTEPAYQPQYRQIEQALRERISTLRPGERLPSDAELCAEFGVSRMTARNAMHRLAEDGLIAREPGRGSFVAEPPAHRRANRLMTFTHEMLRAGRVPSSRVLTRVIRPSTTAEAASLGIPTGQPIVHLRRLRQADGEPIAFESTVLIGACANAVMTADLATGSLHETLGRAGIVLRRGTGTIVAAAATAEDARLLGIRTGDPLLVEGRVIIDGHGRRIESTESRRPVARRSASRRRFDLPMTPGTSGARRLRPADDRRHAGHRPRPAGPRRPGRGRPDDCRGWLDHGGRPR